MNDKARKLLGKPAVGDGGGGGGGGRDHSHNSAGWPSSNDFGGGMGSSWVGLFVVLTLAALTRFFHRLAARLERVPGLNMSAVTSPPCAGEGHARRHPRVLIDPRTTVAAAALPASLQRDCHTDGGGTDTWTRSHAHEDTCEDTCEEPLGPA